jgi:hypothetical protein
VIYFVQYINWYGLNSPKSCQNEPIKWAFSAHIQGLYKICRHRLRVLRISGPKREEVAGGWRKLHEELHNLNSSPNGNQIKEDNVDRTHNTHRRDEKCI